MADIKGINDPKESEDNSTPSIENLSVPYKDGKSINCISLQPYKSSGSSMFVPRLIFTHGGVGDVQAPNVLNLAKGFATILPILCFDGDKDMNSRADMFQALVQHYQDDNNNPGDHPLTLGGRSLGGRAASLAASTGHDGSTIKINSLVLVSYPLHAGEELRAQFLLDLPSETDVLFMIGDNDHMCSIARLEPVRLQMKAKSWLVVVSTGTHGMDISPERGTEDVGKLIGVLAAQWLGERDRSKTEGSVWWDDEVQEAKWDGWKSPTAMLAIE